MIVPFEDEHLDAAAELLAEQVRETRQHEPALSQRFEQPAQARKPLDFVWQLPMSGGTVAIADDRVVGFMLGLAFPDDISHYALAPFCAVTHSLAAARGDILRELYAALAQEWVDAGCIGHYPTVPASESELVEAWFSLGFGKDNVVATRDTSPPPERPLADGIAVRRAGVNDEPAIQRLYDALVEHLGGPPLFIARRPEVRAERRELRERLAVAGSDVYFVAERSGRVIGVQHWEPSASGRPYLPEGCLQLQHASVAPGERGNGVGTAIFAAGLAWAREAGYDHCIVQWETANLDANRFWPAHGFRPFSYQLGRRIERR